MKTAKERFDEKWEPVTESGCWIWTAYVMPNNYGYFYMGEIKRAHRASWIIHKGPIPDGMYVLHKCDIRECVNPDHLFIGTQKDNMGDRDRKNRNYWASKTHCKRGHLFDETNTYVYGGGKRKCRKCTSARHKKAWLKKKSETVLSD